MTLALTNARLLDPATGRETPGGVLIKDGRIAALGPAVQHGHLPEGAEAHDCGGLLLAPELAQQPPKHSQRTQVMRLARGDQPIERVLVSLE